MGIGVYIANVLILALLHPLVTVGPRKFPSLSRIQNHYLSSQIDSTVFRQVFGAAVEEVIEII